MPKELGWLAVPVVVILVVMVPSMKWVSKVWGHRARVSRRRRRRRHQRDVLWRDAGVRVAGHSGRYEMMDGDYLAAEEIDFLSPEMVYCAMEEEWSDLEKEGGNLEEPDNCAVCLEEIVDGDFIRSLPCEHEFHSKCIFAWLRRCQKCPLCMQSAAPSMMVDRKQQPEEVTA